MQLQFTNKVKVAIAASKPFAVTDYETKEPKMDDKGQQLYSVQTVLVLENERPETVKIVGAVKGEIESGDMLALDGLSANFYTLKDGKSGLSVKAQAIRKAA